MIGSSEEVSTKCTYLTFYKREWQVISGPLSLPWYLKVMLNQRDARPSSSLPSLAYIFAQREGIFQGRGEGKRT